MGARIRDKPLIINIDPNDLLLISEEVSNNVFESKRCPISTLFDQIPVPISATANVTLSGDELNVSSDVIMSGTLTITGNTEVGMLKTTEDHITIGESLTPANSSVDVSNGAFFWDNNYLYMQTPLGIKRVTLEDF